MLPRTVVEPCRMGTIFKNMSQGSGRGQGQRDVKVNVKKPMPPSSLHTRQNSGLSAQRRRYVCV